MSPPADRCPGCGLAVPGGADGCRAILDEVLARDFSNALYFRVHRMMIDTYALQHPDGFCASKKSFAAHLTGLCWALERGGDRAVGSERLRRWVERARGIVRPEPPPDRGSLTIADVQDAADPVAYAEAVERWGRATWEAYSGLHAVARRWIQEALAGRG